MGRDHAATRLARSRRSERSGRAGRGSGTDPDLERIHEFTSLAHREHPQPASTRAAAARARARRCRRPTSGVLRMVQRHGPIAVSEVARRLEVDLSNASRQLRALEDQGLVTRTVDPDDRHVARVAVTAAGRRRARPGARGRAQRLRGRARRLVGATTARSSPTCSTASAPRCSPAEPDESGWSVRQRAGGEQAGGHVDEVGLPLGFGEQATTVFVVDDAGPFGHLQEHEVERRHRASRTRCSGRSGSASWMSSAWARTDASDGGSVPSSRCWRSGRRITNWNTTRM